MFLAALLGGLGLVHTHAQFNFDCGSRGTEPLNVTADTNMALPPDGVLHFTTITVASGAKLTFTPNDLNTPVYLLAKGDVVIDGTIDVSGAAGTAVLGGVGGPGGFAGGNAGVADLPAGDGQGPGAGRAGMQFGPEGGAVGAAAYGSVGQNTYGTTNTGTTYGSPLLVPLVGGSGGGGIHGGPGASGGGGAVLIASNTRIDVNGTIMARSLDASQAGNYGCGSGGAIRLVAPAVGGAGTLTASGGANLYYGSYVGGFGRIRVDCMDRRSLATLNMIGPASVGANMIVFPPNAPRLDIAAVGANTIPVPADGPVFFMLPQDSNTNQTVRVRATDFKRVVPIRVVLTPDNGPSSSYDAEIDNSAAGSAEIEVSVVVPVNVQVHVNAWTR